MKERLIKIKLARYNSSFGDWTIKSITGAIILQDPKQPNLKYRAGSVVTDEVAQRWVDSFRTYEVTCTD